jgi:hypothetical protein
MSGPRVCLRFDVPARLDADLIEELFQLLEAY